MKLNLKLLFCAAILLLLCACSETPKAVEKKAPPKPAEPISALSAFVPAFGYARGNWTPDVQVMRIRSIRLPEVKAEAGKYPAWEFQCVSERLRKSRTVTYSVAEAGGQLHKGVFAGVEQGWAGVSGQTKPFLIAAFKVDSSAAYQTAAGQKQAVEYGKKHPDLPVTMQLEQTSRFPNPAWRVIWGDSPATSNFSIYVDASTGSYLETAR